MKLEIPGTDAAEKIRKTFKIKTADLAVVLGSGWSDLINTLEPSASIPFSKLPGMGNTSIKGHAGRLHLIKHNKKNVLIFQGRRHFYEGCGWTPVLMPVYLSLHLKIPYLLLTNAAGGINPKLKPGTIMLIQDHINMMGVNPLCGPHNPALGTRFPDQTNVYDPNLCKILMASAKQSNVTLKKGIYTAVSGPTYETPAEIRAYRTLGADAIGMSTVPEAVVANSAGIKVCALSCIANTAAGSAKVTHSEVLDNTQRAMPAMADIIRNFINQLPA